MEPPRHPLNSWIIFIWLAITWFCCLEIIYTLCWWRLRLSLDDTFLSDEKDEGERYWNNFQALCRILIIQQVVPGACVKLDITVSGSYRSHFLVILNPCMVPSLLIPWFKPPLSVTKITTSGLTQGLQGWVWSIHSWYSRMIFLRWQSDYTSSLALTAPYCSWLKSKCLHLSCRACLSWPRFSPLLVLPADALSFWNCGAQVFCRAYSFGLNICFLLLHQFLLILNS